EVQGGGELRLGGVGEARLARLGGRGRFGGSGGRGAPRLGRDIIRLGVPDDLLGFSHHTCFLVPRPQVPAASSGGSPPIPSRCRALLVALITGRSSTCLRAMNP